ncbi:SMP-30/gluconolactonase/LRE family protein [bacterium]|nr:SMP-30/gluconolactonase/LRE family protein [bacterium]
MDTFEPRPLVDGLVFPEGPRWHDGRLWFSDMHDRAVFTVTLKGELDRVANVPERPSGLGFLPDGRLLVVSMCDRRLLRLDPDVLREHANLTDVALGDLNDMVVDSQGRAYVGNFGFDYNAGGEFKPANLVMVQPDGAVRVVADDLLFPNGPVITPDNRTLIVAETYGRRLTAFSIAEDGSLENRRVFAEFEAATPDGICLDADGAIWVGSPSTEEFLRVREGGEITARIPTPGRWAVACEIGGPDGRTLFLLSAETSRAELSKGNSKGWIDVVDTV